MALSIVGLYDQKYISQMGTEYVCTGFMFDISQPQMETQLGEQMNSFDFTGVQDEGFNLAVNDLGTLNASTPGATSGQTGGMGGGSYS